MQDDAYAAFVSVDVEATRPLAVIGLLGGTEYADFDDETGREPRRFRHSLEVMKRAVQYWKVKGPAACVIHLGNLLAAENASVEKQWTALETFEEVRVRASTPWHFAPGVADHECFGSAGPSNRGAINVAAALRPSRDDGGAERSYYAFFPCEGWRVVVLDAFDVSLLAPHGSDAHAAALELLRTQNPNPPDAPDPLAGLAGEARRFGPSGGGIGALQLQWLSAQLSVAEAANERMVVVSHLTVATGNPQHLLFNHEEVLEKLEAYPGVVAAVVSMGDGEGAYERTRSGIHLLQPCDACHREVNEDAYGALTLYADKMRLEMVGALPNPVRRPEGWPDELELPTTRHQLSVPGFEGGAALGVFVSGFMQMWLVMLHVLTTPVRPLFRLISSADGEGGEGTPTPAPAPPEESAASVAVEPPAAPSGGGSGGGSGGAGEAAANEEGVVV